MHFCSWKVLESIFSYQFNWPGSEFFRLFRVSSLVFTLMFGTKSLIGCYSHNAHPIRAKWSQYLFEIPSEGSNQLNRMIEKHILSDLYWLHNANSKRRRLLLTLNPANWGDLARPFCFWQVSLDKNPLRPTVLNWLYIFSLKNESDLINWIQVTGVRLYFLSVNFRFENTPLVCFG